MRNFEIPVGILAIGISFSLIISSVAWYKETVTVELLQKRIELLEKSMQIVEGEK